MEVVIDSCISCLPSTVRILWEFLVRKLEDNVFSIAAFLEVDSFLGPSKLFDRVLLTIYSRVSYGIFMRK